MHAEAHLAAIIASSDDAIVSKDLCGRVVSWNPAAQRIFGYAEEEMIGRSIRLLIPQDRQDEEDQILAAIASGNHVPSFETWRLRKDGTPIRVAVTVSPIHDSDGQVVGASKIARDITARHATETALRESEERFRMLADNISQFAWIADRDGAVTWYNQRWYDYTGSDPARMQGEGWRAVHHPDHVDQVVERFRAARASGTDWEDTFPLRRADGAYRWYLSRAKPIRDADGEITYWFGTNTDITELLDKEQQIRMLMMEVNHRSKNLLTVVQALARRSAQHDPEFLLRFEQRIASLAANQDLLIRRGWSQIPVAELVDAQLAFLGKDTLEHVTVVAGPDFEVSPRSAEIIGMALHELATNALKYGALSVSEGVAEVGWMVRGEKLGLWWVECNGPPVTPPDKRGFGSTVMRDIPTRSLKADVRLEFREEGVAWQLECDAETAAQL